MEPFEIPTFGIANTDPLDMTHENFYKWLECIPEEKREEMITGEKYASCIITGAENPKPKKNKNKTILFALPIL